MNYANLTSILRVLLIPPILLFYYSDWALAAPLAAAVFAVASLTDWLDGYLARRLNQATELGAFLDPVADKLLVAVVSLALLATHPPLLLPVAVIVARELLISALREWTAAKGKRVAVGFVGKLKATIQMLALTALLLHGDDGPQLLWLLGLGLIYLAAALALWSMTQYCLRAWRSLRWP